MGRNHQRHDVAVQLQTHHSFFPWDTKANKASGKSLESQRINEKLENIKTNISKQYQRLCDRDSYVTAEKVRNAF